VRPRRTATLLLLSLIVLLPACRGGGSVPVVLFLPLFAGTYGSDPMHEPITAVALEILPDTARRRRPASRYPHGRR
jgi:hypothetical protein